MPQLDGLRAVAVLAVLYTHYLADSYWLLGVYWGGLGVRLFFVLSGFLITGILLRESEGFDGKPGERWFLLRHFYIRRALRLTPIFYLTLIAMFALNAPNTRQTVWWHVFYLSNLNFALRRRVRLS
jgi:peptidoglycan/LPS O-acetylase OafA/YrhL